MEMETTSPSAATPPGPQEDATQTQARAVALPQPHTEPVVTLPFQVQLPSFHRSSAMCLPLPTTTIIRCCASSNYAVKFKSRWRTLCPLVSSFECSLQILLAIHVCGNTNGEEVTNGPFQSKPSIRVGRITSNAATSGAVARRTPSNAQQLTGVLLEHRNGPKSF
jgi:hypothetical protein